MKFDILEIQRFIEEKRLFYGQILEKSALTFLKRLANYFTRFFLDFFSSKKSIFISCSIIIIASFFLRLNSDFGVRSAYLLDQTRLSESFHFFPLNHFFASLIVFISSKFNLDLRIASELIINLTGIFSLIICYKILFTKKNEFITRSALYLRHSLLLAACTSFFFRIYLIQFNEYLTFSGIFLALIWPIICICVKKDRFSYIIISLVFIGLAAFLNPIFLIESNLYNKNYFQIIRSDFLLSILFFSFTFSYLKTNNLLKTLILLSALSALFAGFEINYEFRSLFFAFILPAVFYTVFLMIRDDKLQLKKNWLWISILIICAQFDIANFTALTLNLSALWLFFLGKEIWFNKNNSDYSFTKILTLAILISYFVTIIFAMILTKQNLYAASLKSPNYVSNQQYAFIQQYTPKNEITIISDELSDFYPLLLNEEPQSSKDNFSYKNSLFLFKNISEKINNKIQLSLLNKKINDKNNRLIFVRIKNFSRDRCKIGFLENYFYDENFKKIFLQNYQFLSEIEEIEKIKSLRMLSNRESESYEGFEEFSLIRNKIEVYIRKDAI